MKANAFLAPSLDQLRDEVNKRFPHRDKASDGWIGDPAHSSRESQHNPMWDAPGKWSGVVQAIDLDSNGKPGQLTPVVKAILDAAIGDPRVWYVIWNRGIWSRKTGWAREHYDGANPHNSHVHVSIRENIDSWGDRSAWLEEAPVKPPSYRPMPACDLAFWNMNNGARPGVWAALDAIAASGCRLIGLNECGGHWKTIRAWCGARGFTIVTGSGAIGSASAALVRHRTGHKAGGVKTINVEWEGPRGKEIAGRPIVYEKAVPEEGRRVMTLVFHQVWGPNREGNDDAKRALVEQQREWIAANPGWDVYVAPDWNESRTSRAPFSPLGTANALGGRILKGGDGADYVLYVPATEPTKAMSTKPARPTVVVGPDFDSDHHAVGVRY